MAETSDYEIVDQADAPETPRAQLPDYELNLKLFPQRSLKPEHFSKMLLVLIVICTLASIRFIIVGAWPVVFFLGADVLALWFAFFLSYRRGRVFETVQLSKTDLIISKCDARGGFTSVRFEPYWATVSLNTVGAEKNILTVSHHEKTVEIGDFLVPHERHQLAATISEALQAWRAR